MAVLTLSLPDNLVTRLQAQREQMPRILELGLMALDARSQSEFEGVADVLELLAGLPSPEQILNLRPSPRLKLLVSNLVEKSRAGAMTPQDEEEWQSYEYLEGLVRVAKTSAQNEVDYVSLIPR